MFLIGLILELDKPQWSELGWAKKFRKIWEGTRDNCERINGARVSPKDFIARYEAIYKPVVITNVQVSWLYKTFSKKNGCTEITGSKP